MKEYLFIAIGIIVIVSGAYWAGSRIGVEKCRTEYAAAQTKNSIKTQEQIIEIKGDVNAETFNTTVADIRNRLREKYTIRD